MRVLLAVPSQREIYGSLRPPQQINMGIAYLAAIALKKGHYVEVLDEDSEMLGQHELKKKIVAGKFEITGVTVTTPTLHSALRLAAWIKDASPSTIVVFGGMHPSVEPVQTIENSQVDFVVKGEGEITFSELLDEIEGGKNYSSVRGIFFKNNGSIEETRERPLIDELDTIPFPAREVFKNKIYTYPDSLHEKTAPIITSRGCLGRCTYCNAQSIFGKTFRARSPENIVAEIEELKYNYGIKEIHIWDDNFVTDKKRVLALRDEIKKNRIKVKFAFPNGIRADFVDEEIIAALKDMGTYSVAIGVESGNIDVLKKANKGIRLDTVENAFKIIKKYKIESWAFFMFGLPGENLSAAYDTIKFAKKLNPDIAKFHILKPFPGTAVYNYMKENGLLKDLDYRHYGIHTGPVHNLEELSGDDLVKIQRTAYRRFYFRPMVFLRQILRLKSLNRLKLNIKSAFAIMNMAFK